MQNKFSSLFEGLANMDERSAKSLINALDKNNQPGFDYLEFKQSLAALANLGIDESTSFRSAFATAATMGLTRDKLLTTAAFYQKVLQQEKIKFDKTVQQQMQRKIAGKQKEAEALKKFIIEKSALVEKLQSEIAQAKEKIAAASGQIDSAKEKIGGIKANFDATLGSLVTHIQEDVDKIEMYL